MSEVRIATWGFALAAAVVSAGSLVSAGNNVPVTANHPFHSGDLVNVNVGPDGNGVMTHVTSRVSLSSGKLSIYDVDGGVRD